MEEMIVNRREELVRVSHCYHDTGELRARGDSIEGREICCNCGHVRDFKTTKIPVPGHGKFFIPTQTVRVYEQVSPAVCQLHEAASDVSDTKPEPGRADGEAPPGNLP